MDGCRLRTAANSTLALHADLESMLVAMQVRMTLQEVQLLVHAVLFLCCSEQARHVELLQCRVDALHLESEHLRSPLAAYHETGHGVTGAGAYLDTAAAGASGNGVAVRMHRAAAGAMAASGSGIAAHVTMASPSHVRSATPPSLARPSSSSATPASSSAQLSSSRNAVLEKDLAELRGRHDAALREIAAMQRHVRVLPAAAVTGPGAAMPSRELSVSACPLRSSPSVDMGRRHQQVTRPLAPAAAAARHSMEGRN